MMGFVTIHHSVIHCFWEIPQHGLFGGIVGDLHHYQFVFTDFISDGIGIVHQIFAGVLIGNKQLIQSIVCLKMAKIRPFTRPSILA